MSAMTGRNFLQTPGPTNIPERVLRAMDTFFAENPPPEGLEPRWFGLTYINVIWQEKMVSGMARAFFGSFIVVLVMMSLIGVKTFIGKIF